MIYVALVAYVLISLALGLIARRMEVAKTPEDYFLANRGLGILLLFFTMIATNFSAFFFLGFAGAGYRIGLSYYAMMAYGLALLYMAVMVVFTLPYIAIQPIGAGYLLEQLTNGEIPYFWGASLLTTVMVAYVWLGGMRSVALTDAFQGVMMFVFMFLAMFTIAEALGGFTQANVSAWSHQPALFSREGVDGYFTPQKWISFMMLWIVSIPMFPQIFMRYYTARSARGLYVTALLYPIVTVTLFLCPVLIGIWGHLKFPGLEGKASMCTATFGHPPPRWSSRQSWVSGS